MTPENNSFPTTRIELPVDPRLQALDANRRVDITVDLDRDVVSKFQATGPGWRERMEAVLSTAKLA